VQEPRVTVIVREVNSSRVFVTGEVAHPGAYPLRGRVSLLQAIALAGGFTDFANSDGIVVIRTDGKGGQIPVRYSDLVSPEGESVILRPGDTVVVP
jgi:polysaccharide export outer membrane protein